MKEILQTAGIRHWFGDELVALQSETLQPLQGFLSKYGTCALAGCVVSRHMVAGLPVLNHYDISPGWVGIVHDDGYKIAYYGGTSNLDITSGPRHLCIQKTVSTATYENDLLGNPGPVTGDGANNYEAAISFSAPTDSEYLLIDGSLFTTFDEAFIAFNTGAWQSVNYNLGNAIGTIYYRLVGLTSSVQIKGSLLVTPNSVSPHDPPYYYAGYQLPVGYRPVTSVPFKCFVRYHTPAGNTYITESTGLDYIKDINAELGDDGYISIGLLPTASNYPYTVYFNDLLPLG